MLLATLTFSVMNVCVKLIPHIPAIEIIVFRSAVSLAVSYAMLKRLRVPLFGNNKKLLLARGAFGAVSLSLLFTTFHNMPLASAVMLHYLAPVFTAIITFYVLGERVYKIQWLFFSLCFVGILMIKGYDPRVPLPYFVMGVVAAFLSGCAYTCIRKMKASEHPLVIVFYFPLVALPVALAVSVFYWVPPTGTDWLYLLAIGLLTQVAQVYMTKAYQAEVASRVASVNYTGAVYALFFGLLFFNETFNLMVMAGMAVVLTGVVLNINAKRLVEAYAKRRLRRVP